MSDSVLLTKIMLINQGIQSIMQIGTSLSVWNGQSEWLRDRALSSMLDLLYEYVPFTSGHLYAALVYNQSNALDPARRHLFEVIGIQHMLSASGYNVSVLLAAAQVVGGGSSTRGKTGLLGLGLAVIYTWLLAWPVSLLRALAMVAYSWVATSGLARQYRPLFGLIVTALSFGLIDQSILDSLSFQLSVSATLGIILFAPLAERLQSELLREGIALTLAAQAFSLPLVLHAFGKLSTLSVLANLCLFWISSVVFLCGLGGSLVLVACALLPIGGAWLSAVVGMLLWLPASLFDAICWLFDGADATVLHVNSFSWLKVVVWWVVVLIFWRAVSFWSERRLKQPKQPPLSRSVVSCYQLERAL